MKFCLIKQPAGLGDIIFCQKIGVKILEKYKLPVIWPVIKQYADIGSYIKNNIWFVDKETQYPGKEYYENFGVVNNDEILYIPLENASHIVPNKKVFESKYDLVGLSYDDWLNYFSLERNKSKENFLYYKILNLKDDEKYILVNKNFASPPHTQSFDIRYPRNIKQIEMQYHPGFSIFDWCKVIENAEGIYSMDTCINFFIEKLNLKASVIEITSRRPGNWSELDYVFSKPFTRTN